MPKQRLRRGDHRELELGSRSGPGADHPSGHNQDHVQGLHRLTRSCSLPDEYANDDSGVQDDPADAGNVD
jgi:hypothetical protein